MVFSEDKSLGKGLKYTQYVYHPRFYPRIAWSLRFHKVYSRSREAREKTPKNSVAGIE